MQQIKFCDIAKFAIVPNSPLFIEKIKFSVSVVKYMLEGIEKTTHTHTHTIIFTQWTQEYKKEYYSCVFPGSPRRLKLFKFVGYTGKII